MKRSEILDNLMLVLLGVLVFSFPLFFLPLTPEFYDWNKQILLLGGSLLLLILWAIRGVKEGRLVVRRASLDLFFLGFLAVHLMSTFVNPDFASALMGRVMFFAALFLFYFVAVQIIDSREKVEKAMIRPLILSAFILSLIQITQTLGISFKFINAGIGEAWTPAGNQYALLAVLVPSFVITSLKAAKKIVGSPEENQSEASLALKGGLLLCGAALILASIVIFASKIPPLLPHLASWQIATRVLGENPKSAFLGFGPENFSAAFTRFKPASLNATPLWNTIFFKSANEPFHLLATCGFLGFVFWILLLIPMVKLASRKIREEKGLSGEGIALLGLAALQLIFPPNMMNWFLLLLLWIGLDEKNSVAVDLTRIKPPVALSLALILSLGLTFFVIQAYRGERFFYQSLKALEQGKGIDAYNLQIAATKVNPQNYRYHLSFSQTNRLLANAVLQDLQTTNLEGENEELTRKKAQTTQLIQQSIIEAKRAAALAPNRFETWRNLAEIYRSLIGLFDGAQNWAIASYQNAIILNPLDPELRINLGGVFYGLEEWDEAVYTFRLATQAKPDHANAWYNLAAAYRQAGDSQKAAIALQNVTSILPEDDPDKMKAQSELEELTEKLSAEQKEALKEATPSSELQPQVPETKEEKEASPSGESPFSPFVE